MPPAVIRDRLLREAVARRELSAKAGVAVQDLLRHHLSFEQALVGTRLISAERFSEWMQEASGLPLVTTVSEVQGCPPGIERETALGWGIIPRRIGGERWQIALSDPWDKEVRSTIEALAVEHGWQIEWAFVLPSTLHQHQKTSAIGSHKTAKLVRLTRELFHQVAQARTLTITSQSTLVHPTKQTKLVSPALIPALSLRLKRRSQLMGVSLRTEEQARSMFLTLSLERALPSVQNEPGEHPILDWSDTFARALNEGTLLFVFDGSESIESALQETHTPYVSTDWRSGQRWLSTPEPALQEELLHFAMAGYGGTVRFSSLPTLAEWERAAHAMGVAHAVCKGIPTAHGIAWSVYTV